MVEAGFELISQNPFPSLFQTTYKYIKFWESFSWSLLVNTRENRFLNASLKSVIPLIFHSIFSEGYCLHVEFISLMYTPAKKFCLEISRLPSKDIFQKSHPEMCIWGCSKVSLGTPKKKFRSECRNTLDIFLPENFTEHLQLKFEKTCW